MQHALTYSHTLTSRVLHGPQCAVGQDFLSGHMAFKPFHAKIYSRGNAPAGMSFFPIFPARSHQKICIKIIMKVRESEKVDKRRTYISFLFLSHNNRLGSEYKRSLPPRRSMKQNFNFHKKKIRFNTQKWKNRLMTNSYLFQLATRHIDKNAISSVKKSN